MSDKQLSVAELLQRMQQEGQQSVRPEHRRARSEDSNGGLSVADLLQRQRGTDGSSAKRPAWMKDSSDTTTASSTPAAPLSGTSRLDAPPTSAPFAASQDPSDRGVVVDDTDAEEIASEESTVRDTPSTAVTNVLRPVSDVSYDDVYGEGYDHEVEADAGHIGRGAGRERDDVEGRFARYEAEADELEQGQPYEDVDDNLEYDNPEYDDIEYDDVEYGEEGTYDDYQGYEDYDNDGKDAVGAEHSDARTSGGHAGGVAPDVVAAHDPEDRRWDGASRAVRREEHGGRRRADETDDSAGESSWIWLVIQAILAAAVGALTFKAFELLWESPGMTVITIILAIVVIVGLVAVVRVLRRQRDVLSMLIALAVGLGVTCGPLLLVAM